MTKVAAEDIKESKAVKNLDIGHNAYSVFAYRMRSKWQGMNVFFVVVYFFSLSLKEL